MAAKEGVAGGEPQASWGQILRAGALLGPEWEPHLAGETSSTPYPSLFCRGRQHGEGGLLPREEGQRLRRLVLPDRLQYSGTQLTGSHCPACVPCLSNNLWRQAFTYRLKGIENTDVNTQPRFIKYPREAKTMKVSTKLNKWMSWYQELGLIKNKKNKMLE